MRYQRPDSISFDSSKETQPLLDHQIPISESGLPTSGIGSYDHQVSSPDNLPLSPTETTTCKNNVTNTASSLFMTPLSQSSTHSPRQTPLSSSAVPGGQSVISASLAPPANGSSRCASCGAQQPSLELDLKIDKLTRKMESLEHSMANDIRLILNLLRQHNSQSSTELKEQSWQETRTRVPHVRRSLSVPQNETSLRTSEPSRSSHLGEQSREVSVSVSDPIHDQWTFLTPPNNDYKTPFTIIPRRSLSQPVSLSQGQTDWLHSEAAPSNFPPINNSWLFEQLGLGFKRKQHLAETNTVSEDMMEFQALPQTSRPSSLQKTDAKTSDSTPIAESPEDSKKS